MTDEEQKAVLERAVELANANGWGLIGKSDYYVCPRCDKLSPYKFGEYCSDHGLPYETKVSTTFWRIEKSDHGGMNRGLQLYVSYGPRLVDPYVNYLKMSATQLIFSHDFARALWGDERWGLTDSGEWWDSSKDFDDMIYAEFLPAWQYHLQQMVISEDPIEYLAENMPKGNGDASRQ